MFSKAKTRRSTNVCSPQIKKLENVLNNADAVVIGAGAGLSASAGFIYKGKRFETYFSDFAEKYHFSDMYSGGFYNFSSPEEYWAYWSRYIFINRYMDAPKPVYDHLLKLVSDKDYFVITTNVDHMFQKSGFDKKRLFYTQGDYGLFQCSEPCHMETYDNETIVRKMIAAQGFAVNSDRSLCLPAGNCLKMSVPTELIPICPHCGKPMAMNLRCDNKFVEDDGWHMAAERYENFLRTRSGLNILFFELGVGCNTPGIIKYPFWNMTAKNLHTTYACINAEYAVCPGEIRNQAICISDDIGSVLETIIME